MKEKRFSTKEKIALIILLILMGVVLGVGAYIIVNNVNTANEKAKNPTSVTATGDTSLLVEKDTSKQQDNKPEVTDKSKGSKNQKETETVIDTKSNKTSSNNSSKVLSNTTSRTSSATTSKTSSQGANNKVPVVKPDTNSSHASKDVCTINGTKCYVGDTITMALNLKTPKVLINFQGFTQYDNSYLKFENAEANVSGLVNNHKSTILYNGSNIATGFDFTSTGTIYTAKFKVLKKGKTSITNTIEVLTDMKDVAVNPDKCTISIKVYN